MSDNLQENIKHGYTEFSESYRDDSRSMSEKSGNERQSKAATSGSDKSFLSNYSFEEAVQVGSSSEARRLENVVACHTTLKQLVGEHEAMKILAKTLG